MRSDGGEAPARRLVILLAAVLTMAVTARMGWWQLDRAQQKLELQASIERQALLPPLTEADLAHDPGQLVAGDQRVRRRSPLTARGVDVGVTDTGEPDLEVDLRRPGLAPRDGRRGEGTGGGIDGVRSNLRHEAERIAHLSRQSPEDPGGLVGRSRTAGVVSLVAVYLDGICTR